MSAAALLDDLLQAFTGAAPAVVPADAPAKAANPANRKHWRGILADGLSCEVLRIPANPAPANTSSAEDSQTFASVRSLPNALESEERRALSQDSQDSQRLGPTQQCLDLAAVAWTDADVSRFLHRRARLLRWGWAEPEAEALAERLVKRDRDTDPRVTCTECSHYRPGRCSNHRSAGLSTAEVGRDLAGMLQRCAGFFERGKA